jgi:hypothetical protein
VAKPPSGRAQEAIDDFMRHGSTLSIVVCMFVVLLVSFASPTAQTGVTVYALSFGHYFAYWLAYRHGAVDPATFRRDSILLKTLSLSALAWAFFVGDHSAVALAAMTAGFGLNMLAAYVLGAERTYYGFELGVLPPRRITRFPFSVIPHPMLTGNMFAYAGALLDDDFRRDWWPLSVAHVALNAGLLLMELKVTPRGAASAAARDVSLPRARGATALRRSVSGSLAAIAAGLATGAAIGAWAQAAFSPQRPLLDAGVIGACLGILAVVMYRSYTTPPGVAFETPSSRT